MDPVRMTKARLLEELEGAKLREARFRAIAESTYDVECLLDSTGRVRWINPAVERLTGLGVGECLGLDGFPLPLVLEGDRPLILEALAAARAGTPGNDLSFRMRGRGGEVVWAALSWQSMAGLAGEPAGIRFSIRDIGGRRRAEAALEEQKRLLDDIIEHIPAGVYWKDLRSVYRGCNREFARAAGVGSPAEIVGKTDYELAWERSQSDSFRDIDVRVMTRDEPLLNLEGPERLADGRQAILLTSKVPLRGPDGAVTGVLGVDVDISELKRVEEALRRAHDELDLRVRQRTAELAAANDRLSVEIAERRRAEEALRVSQERYRLVSELTSDYAYVLRRGEDGGLALEWRSDALSRILGASGAAPEAALPWAGVAHPDDRSIVERRRAALDAGRSSVQEFRVVAPDGATRWVRDYARPVRDGRGERIVGAAQDITDRKLAEEEARRHEAAMMHFARVVSMNQLAGQLAHELSQPLCAIIGNAQTARRILAGPGQDPRELGSALDDIVADGMLAGRIIQRLKDFLRKKQPQRLVLNPQRLIEEVAPFAEADARQHGAGLRFQIEPDLPLVQGDLIQIQQVILNLVRNGLEAVSESRDGPREVTLRARSEPEGLVVCVGDTGPGLAAGAEDRLFEPFFTTKASGLGLGLSISRSIVEAHGGRLWATRNPDRGMTFSFTLPRKEA